MATSTVRSKHDYGLKTERAIPAKIADYFAAGTLVVWDVDVLHEQVIRVYRAGDEAEAEPALPGWHVVVSTLFQ